MAQPTLYARQFSFQNYQANTPTLPLPGPQIDTELDAIALTIRDILRNMALLQRDDGELANLSVDLDQLATGLQFGLNPPAPWTAGNEYAITDLVFNGNLLYRAAVAHTAAATFDDDLGEGRWLLVADFSTSVPDGSISAAKLAPNAVTTTRIADGVVTTAKLADNAVMASKLSANAVTAGKINDGAINSTSLFTPEALAAVAAAALPMGTITPFALAALPTGFLWCDGAPILVGAGFNGFRSALLAAGSPYGVDGFSNPRTPDLRGRAPAGRDDMGSQGAAGRLTNTGTGNPGVEGATLGAAGGVDRTALTVAQMPAHDHGGVTNITGAHTHTYTTNQNNHQASGDSGGYMRNPITDDTGSAGDHSHTISSEGGGEAHPIVQPTLIVNYIVKAV